MLLHNAYRMIAIWTINRLHRMVDKMNQWWKDYQLCSTASITLSFVSCLNILRKGNTWFCVTLALHCISDVCQNAHRHLHLATSCWRHDVETLSATLALCAGIQWSSVDSLHKVPMMRSFEVSMFAWAGCRVNGDLGRHWSINLMW